MEVFYVMVMVLVAGAVPSHGRTESEGTVFIKTQPHESMNNVTISSSKLEPYSYLYLAMRWPRSFCNIYRRCQRPVPGYFTVHGLWAQHNPYSGVNCTDISKRGRRYPLFNNRLLDRSLLLGLNMYWPDLTTGKNNLEENNNQRFWETEYNKHGSCTFTNQNVYFARTLTMVESLGDLISKLSRIKRPIIPDNYYLLRRIRAAVQEVTNKVPTLHCMGNQLLEIRFCAHSNSNQVLGDCNFYSNCGKWIYLPRP